MLFWCLGVIVFVCAHVRHLKRSKAWIVLPVNRVPIAKGTLQEYKVIVTNIGKMLRIYSQ